MHPISVSLLRYDFPEARSGAGSFQDVANFYRLGTS